jgi:hypothetical protein
LKTDDIELDLVIPSEIQTDLLYQQLCSRTCNISHHELPSYENHKEFVSKHPYRAWFIIKSTDLVLGNVYVQYDNSIGLNCCNQISEIQIKSILDLISIKLKPLDPIPSVRSNNFFLNVATSNIELQNKLTNLGLIESQRSFVFQTKQ